MKQPPAFDAYAAGYDRHFTDSAIGRIQREQVWQALLPLLNGRVNVLEVNCGTGEDAIRLAKLGHCVLATDLSGEMIRMAEEKRKTTATLPGLQFLQAGFQELPTVLEERRFELIFSNFGGLNCISPEENRRLSDNFYQFLQPGGLLFLVLMSRRCWWERFYFYLKGELEKAGRRRARGPVTASLGGQRLKVWYYSPGEVARAYAPRFSRIGLLPIGLFTPPSCLEPLFSRHPGWLFVLKELDAVFRFSSLADYADHFAVILKKND